MRGPPDVPEESVTVGPATRFRGALVWALFTATAFGAFSAGALITQQDTSQGDVSQVKADVSQVNATLATKADVADLKDLAAKVVTKEVFDVVTRDLLNRLETQSKATDRLASELADARREQAEANRRMEDLIRELPKQP